MSYKIITALLLAVALTLALTACGGTGGGGGSSLSSSSQTAAGVDGQESQPAEKAKLPDLEMEDLEGNKVNLADYIGSKTYIEFWASWCPNCIKAMPELNALSTDEAAGFKVLTVVTPGKNGEKNKEDFITWFKELADTENITVLLDMEGQLAKDIGVYAYPTGLFVNTAGEMEYLQVGYPGTDRLKEVFAELS